jgi:hypothetical protein
MLSRIDAIISKVGEDAIFKKAVATYTPSTRSNSSSFTNYPVKAFVYSSSPNKLAGLSDQNTRYVAISALDLTFTPVVNQDKLVLDSVEYVILSSDKRKIGNASAMFILGISSNGE